jgi:hypothetical protein
VFSARGNRQRAEVEKTLAEYGEIIDQWLELSEEPRPRKISAEEQTLRAILKKIAENCTSFSTAILCAPCW